MSINLNESSLVNFTDQFFRHVSDVSIPQAIRGSAPQISPIPTSETDSGLAQELLCLGRQYASHVLLQNKRAFQQKTDSSVLDTYAYQIFVASEKQGNAEAMYEIALCYEKGKGVVQDWDQAINWYDKSYAAGHQPALLKASNLRKFQLADSAFQGIGVPKNLRQAARWYLSVDLQVMPEVVQKLEACCQEMAQAKDWEGLAMVADYYYEGIAREVDFEKAASLYSQCDLTDFPKAVPFLIDCYQKMADKRDISAMYKLGMLYEQQEDQSSAIFWYQKAVEQGNCKDSAYRLWRIYNVSKDWQSAWKYLEQAAGWGHAEAILEREKQLAAQYEAGAQQGNRECMYRWAQCLEEGFGTTPDQGKAFEWYREAAHHKSCKDSAYRLYQIFQSKQMLKTANYYLNEAAKEGHIKAIWEQKKQKAALHKHFAEQGLPYEMYCWAECLEKGVGIEPDLEQAIHWYKQAAHKKDCSASAYRLYQLYQTKQDDRGAQIYFDLAVRLGHGIARQKQAEQTALYFRTGAEEGNKERMYGWAGCLEKGIGTEPNLWKAIDWYKQAVHEKGCKDSAYRLWQIYQYRLEDEESANVYLHLAAQLGHAQAIQMLRPHLATFHS